MASNQLDNILNFRDVGETVNKFAGKRLLREGVLYRSARPDDATLSDRRSLRELHGIKTVLDLRTQTEHLMQVRKRDADLRDPALLAANPALTEPIKIPGLQYLDIRVTGKNFEHYLLSQLGWISYLKLIALYLLGYQTDAVKILSAEVMVPKGLVGMARETLDQSGSELARALRAMIGGPVADTSRSGEETDEVSAGAPVLVHCTQGKDRTGLVCALTLLALRKSGGGGGGGGGGGNSDDDDNAGGVVPLAAITHDYELTQRGLADAEKPEDRVVRLAELAEIGLTREWADTAPGFVTGVWEHLRDRYGGVEPYLDGIGFGEAERARLVEVLGA